MHEQPALGGQEIFHDQFFFGSLYFQAVKDPFLAQVVFYG
jgi:hypothetical protein